MHGSPSRCLGVECALYTVRSPPNQGGCPVVAIRTECDGACPCGTRKNIRANTFAHAPGERAPLRVAAKRGHVTRGFSGSGALVENDGLVSADENLVFDVVADGLGEDDAFEIAALADQIVDRIAVVHGQRGLGDDGP